MKYAAQFAILAAAASLAVGCSNDKKAATTTGGDASVTDIRAANPPPAPPPLVQPVQPVTPSSPVQPVISDTPPVVTQTSASAGGTYTVQKGDTIFKIARARYGDATAVKKIRDANPGLDADHIKAGQKINLP